MNDPLKIEHEYIRLRLLNSQAGVLFKALWENRTKGGLTARALAMKVGWLKRNGEPHPESKLALVYKHIETLRNHLAKHCEERRQEGDLYAEILLSEKHATGGYKLQINPRKSLEPIQPPSVDPTGSETNKSLTNLPERKYSEHSTNPDIHPPPFQLAPLVPYFSGRQEQLARICARVTRNEINTILIWGMPGVGKREFALAVAHALKDRYPDGSLFLRMLGCRKPNKPLGEFDVMRHVVNSVEPTQPAPMARQALTDRYTAILNTKRLLLIIVDAINKKQIGFLPPQDCLFLITSSSKLSIPGCEQEKLEELAPREAVSLLTKLAPRADQFSKRIARLCGHLPLALRVFADTINEKNTFPVHELVDELEKHRRTHTCIDAALETSARRLSSKLYSSWKKLSAFPVTWDAEAAASAWESTPSEARENLQVLVNSSLVQWDDQTHRYSLHDLVRTYLMGKLSLKEKNKAFDDHARYYGALTGRITTQILPDDIVPSLILLDVEWDNIKWGHEWCAQNVPRLARTLLLYGIFADALVQIRMSLEDQVRWWEPILGAASIENVNDIKQRALLALVRVYHGYMDSHRCEDAADLLIKIREYVPVLKDNQPLIAAHSLDCAVAFGLGAITDISRRLISHTAECAQHLKEGRDSQAEACFEKILQSIAAKGQSSERAMAEGITFVARQFVSWDQPGWAIKCLLRGIELSSQFPPRIGQEFEVMWLTLIAWCYAVQEDLTKFKQFLKSAFARIPKKRSDLQAQYHLNTARLFDELGYIDDALASAELALKVLRPLQSIQVGSTEEFVLRLKHKRSGLKAKRIGIANLYPQSE